MEIDQAEAALLLKRARSDREAATTEVARLEALKAQATGLGRFIEGLELMYPALAEPQIEERDPPQVRARTLGVDGAARAFGRGRDPRRGPPVSEVVVSILAEDPPRWFTGRQMIKELEKRGIHGTDTAIRLALKRAADRGHADRRVAENGGQLFRIHRDADQQEVSTP